MACKRKCKTLSLSDKKKLTEEVEKGIKRKNNSAADFGIPTNMLPTIIKNKHLVLSSAEEKGLVPDI
jgi:hypothetical protein